MLSKPSFDAFVREVVRTIAPLDDADCASLLELLKEEKARRDCVSKEGE